MKILIAAASFASNISGVQRHALNLARCLLVRPEIRSVSFVVAPWQTALISAAASTPDARLTTHVVDMESHSLARNIWYYCELPKLAKKLDADLVHFTYPSPVNGPEYSCPTVVTLHDLYPFEIPMNFGFPKFLFNRVVLRQCLRSADAIACVSDTTMMQLRQHFPNVGHKCERIYNCVSAEDAPGEEAPLSGWHDTPFLLSIAQHRRNKNIPMLIRTYDRLLNSGQISSEMKLIVVGINGPETPSLHRLVAEHGLERRVHFLEGLSEGELRWCYRRCAALVAPSITEGFGLPIAEGLLHGCRIVASDIPAHREIAGDRFRLVRLQEDAEERLASAICAALRKPKPQPVILTQLTAPVLGGSYLSLYRRVIAASGKTFATVPAVMVAASERRSV